MTIFCFEVWEARPERCILKAYQWLRAIVLCPFSLSRHSFISAGPRFLSNDYSRSTSCVPRAQDAGGFYFSDCLWNRYRPLWTLHSSPLQEAGHLFQSHADFLVYLCYSHVLPQYHGDNPVDCGNYAHHISPRPLRLAKPSQYTSICARRESRIHASVDHLGSGWVHGEYILLH